MAGNHTPCEQRRSFSRKRKAETSRLTGNHTFWGDKGPRGKESWEKAGISGILMQPFAPCALITIKLALQIRSSHDAPTYGRTLTIKAK